jgi:hypothetical protein
LKNLEEVLRSKELELSRLEKEVEVLRIAMRLIENETDSGAGASIGKIPPSSVQIAESELVRSSQSGGKAAYSQTRDAALKQFP